MTGFLEDLRAGLRVLRTAPALAIGVIAAFALGIGANTSRDARRTDHGAALRVKAAC